jgi:hypothetical protein
MKKDTRDDLQLHIDRDCDFDCPFCWDEDIDENDDGYIYDDEY